MLLNTLQCTGQFPTYKTNYPTQNANGAEVQNFYFKIGKLPLLVLFI